ncbi:hypothetical protein ABZ234_07830 [Nocardiopsis sp. NPDC006198]|uniref:hypothetical protein n=1 Tax=Nocardiopsis sp. NPDC006198 TaxID=3154472 RepID=UPI0033A9FCED
MPITEEDLDDIWATARMGLPFADSILEARLCRNGAQVRVHQKYALRVAELLRGSGYTVQELGEGLMVVTGAVDQLTLLQAEIARLQAEVERVEAGRRAAALLADTA